jgi:hypothetical protein
MTVIVVEEIFCFKGVLIAVVITARPSLIVVDILWCHQ